MQRLLIDRARDALALWEGTVKTPAPEMAQFVRWVKGFTDEQLERVILKCGRKFAATTEPGSVHRYATGTLFHLRLEQIERKKETTQNDSTRSN
jgi:hypothetical protein